MKPNQKKPAVPNRQALPKPCVKCGRVQCICPDKGKE